MTQGLPIGERETIEDVASRIGLNPVEVDDVLDSDEYADFVKFDQEVAREQLKVTGVPFFVFDQRVALAGAQPREVFYKSLKKHKCLQKKIMRHSVQMSLVKHPKNHKNTGFRA